MTEPRTLLEGLHVGESPRWHDGRLWLANWGTGEIVAVDAEGQSEVMARVPTTVPYCFDWLPDGSLLVVSGQEAQLLRQQTDGKFTLHADLSAFASGWNEIVVDGRGNTYVNGSDYKFAPGEPFVPGVVALVKPDGSVQQVADDIHFPNGMVVTPDSKTLVVTESFRARLTAFDIQPDGTLTNRRVFAELGQGGDGICLDREGAIWTSAFVDGRPGCSRVADGGKLLQRIDLDDFCFACMLGGDDGQTLFMLVAEWRGVENAAAMFAATTGRVLTTHAPAPHAGRP
ncbi:MAG: SMP-30/gluconolactonase/LRE family protein [Chloroflexi bacterium]|nr:SMP-30/gluconolactonase/LRE family protein [Chloroflexota bacterium]